MQNIEAHAPSDYPASTPGENSKPNDASTAPRLRTAARHSKFLTAGAKVLFDELTDLQFLGSVSPQPGVVKMSKKVLAQELHVSQRTIYRQARELEGARFVWTRIVWECGFEITLWFIRGLADPKAEVLHRPNPSYGSSRGRRARPAKRDASGRFLHRPATAPDGGQNCHFDGSTVKPAILTELSADYGQECPLTTDTGVPGQWTGMSPVNGQDCPKSMDRNVRSQGTPVSVVNGHDCPLAGDKTVPRPGTPVAEYKETPSEIGAVGDQSFKRLGNRAKEAGSKRSKRLRTDTEEFLSLVREVCGAAEAENNSGLWVTNLHADPGLAYEVMHDTASAKKEGRIKTTPAKHAMDLWKRRWRETHPNESVTAAAERRRRQP